MVVSCCLKWKGGAGEGEGQGRLKRERSLPCKANKNRPRRSIIVLWLMKKRLNILTDGVEVAVLALGLYHLVYKTVV